MGTDVFRDKDWEERYRSWKQRKEQQKNSEKISETPKKEPMFRDLIRKEAPVIRHEKPIFNQPKIEVHKRAIFPMGNKPKGKYFLVIALIALLIGYFTLKPAISNTYFSIIVFSLFILSMMFFGVLFAHRAYEKSARYFSPSSVLSFCYAIIIANMLLSPRIYSLEWAFLGFLVITIIFYDFKIDSRFLILPAIVLLGYVPFLLIGSQKEIAETVAVFVYYFLVVGVVLQIIEYYKQTSNSIDFNGFIENFIIREKIISWLSIWGAITLVIIIYNRFVSIELLKWSAIYVFVVLVVLYGVSYLQEQREDIPGL